MPAANNRRSEAEVEVARARPCGLRTCSEPHVETARGRTRVRWIKFALEVETLLGFPPVLPWRLWFGPRRFPPEPSFVRREGAGSTRPRATPSGQANEAAAGPGGVGARSLRDPPSARGERPERGGEPGPPVSTAGSGFAGRDAARGTRRRRVDAGAGA